MIIGKKIKIRTILEQDLSTLALLLNDIESAGSFLPNAMVSEVGLKKEFHESGFLSDSFSRFLITDHSDHIVGTIWMFKSIPYFDAFEVGYHIFNQDNRGNGLATEALTLFTSYLFDAKQINRVELRIATENPASEKVARKVGFVHEGTHREAAFTKGKMHDMQTFSVLRREWQPING
ncbi:acetyltransferase [Desulfoluna limicola]|uniref:Acetyltransferase n=1 Tax=Desulfoluna limicola TaxID=2810562 RepID=A0ABM7PMF4_9BACT|nr:GNAT family protein [Desulfoluna limicola]BCS98648.1 acetyltransferase [Desulfoluna limicola]